MYAHMALESDTDFNIKYSVFCIFYTDVYTIKIYVVHSIDIYTLHLHYILCID